MSGATARSRAHSRQAIKSGLVLGLACAFAWESLGCGVRQFNAQVPGEATPESREFSAYGPFWASGQNGEGMHAKACSSKTGRPCIRARASAGTPFGYDVNPNAVMGRIPDGQTEFPPVGPYEAMGESGYAAAAEPGKLRVEDGVFAPDHPRMENRDLHLLQSQADSGEHVIAP